MSIARFTTFRAKEGSLGELVSAYTGTGGPVDLLSRADGFETYVVTADKADNCLRNVIVFSSEEALAAATAAPGFEGAKLKVKMHLGGPPASHDGVVCVNRSTTAVDGSSDPGGATKRRREHDSEVATAASPSLALVPAICHVQLFSEDFEATIAFWEAIGYRKVTDVVFGEGQRWTTLGRPGDSVHFTLTKGKGTGEVGHVLSVPDIEASCAFMKTRGVAFKDDKINTETWGHYALFSDPGGNTFCLSQHKQD